MLFELTVLGRALNVEIRHAIDRKFVLEFLIDGAPADSEVGLGHKFYAEFVLDEAGYVIPSWPDHSQAAAECLWDYTLFDALFEQDLGFISDVNPGYDVDNHVRVSLDALFQRTGILSFVKDFAQENLQRVLH